jgi:Tfp pilus assembly protein PilF
MLSGERWLDVKRIASEALELPAESRADFLAQRCPDALRADVQQLLRSCEWVSSTTTFIDTPATEFAAPIIATIEQNPIDLVALQTELVGRYTIERELGCGGMATVYLAHDERHRRRVALKVVHSTPAHLAGSSAARFRREIEIAARLTHPHILPLHDSGAAVEGLYYVMPFVPGENLREHIARSGPLSLQYALRLLRDVARALAYAHREGIVHRDIKPGNILLNQDGDALVADFGIASGLAAARIEYVPEHDGADLALGTPAYSALEQLRGDSDTDQRADLYSFGVMAYEMLCGARPFAGRSTQELLAVQQTEAPESLATRRPDLPPALAALVQRLLSQDPADRPQDAGEVLRSLEAVSIDTEAATNNAPLVKRRVRRRVVALASMVSLAVVGIFALSWDTRRVQAGDVPSARSVGRIAASETNNLEARQAYMRGSAQAEDLRPEMLQAARAQFETALQLDPTYARAWAGLANVYTYQALFSGEPRNDMTARAREALKRAFELDSSLVEAHTVRAHQLFGLECRSDDAERAFERALALDSTYAPARRLYGWFLHLIGRDSSALVQLHRARNLGPVLPGAEALLGRVFVNVNQPDSAIRYLRNALKFNRDHAMAYEQLAFAWLEKSDSAQAIADMRRAAELNGRDSAQLAFIYGATNHRAEARRILRRPVKTESQRQLPVAGTAMAYAALGDVDEAFRILETNTCEPALGVSVGYKSLRSDPRFADLLRRKGLRLSGEPRDR